MAEPNNTAISLMKMALALLDRDGETYAAIYLQSALDIVQNTPPMQPGEELPPDLVERYLGVGK